jgi:sigma-B regulation protein RsbU (phosphoserine phosphatase)
MEPTIFERIRAGLTEKRDNLVRWAQTVAPEKKLLRLGPAGPGAMDRHLGLLEKSICCADEQTLGRCMVCGDTVNARLLESDFTACVCLDHLSPLERQRLEAELELSQVIQRSLLPQSPPVIPGMELAFFSRPAEILGGDFLGFFKYKEGSEGMAIADVAGHGISTSALMASVQTAMHTLVPANDSPAEVLRQVNRFFCHNVNFTTFVTLFLARWDSESRTLCFANAGHNPVLFLSAGGTSRKSIRWLEPTGPAIGLVEDFAIGTKELSLQVGDLLVLYTDGVTEATDPSGREYGTRGLENLVLQGPEESAQQLLARLRHDLQGFIKGRPLADDTTALICRVVDQDAGSA